MSELNDAKINIDAYAPAEIAARVEKAGVGKVDLAIVFPISAFVALGFNHSVANMYLIPAGYLAGAPGVSLDGFIANLVPVTLGNIFGGGVLVALVYWIVYLRKPEL